MKHMPTSPKALVSFAAPQDSLLLAQWETSLLPLQQAGRIALWSERHILPGADRDEQIQQHLEQAQLIVLLLSASFFANRDCYTWMTRALQRTHDGHARIIPLLLRPSLWRETPLGTFSCLPTNGRPVTRWGDRDEAFQDCVDSLMALLSPPASAASVSALSQSPAPAQPGQATLPADHHSCFISYSSKDDALAQRLHTDLKARGVQCWFAPHDMKIGARIRPTIDQAIHQQEKLLLLLSQHSLDSYWVEDEVEAALERERTEQREMLFPIRLDNAVTRPDAPAWAKRLRRQVNIGDFSNWTDSQAYEKAFERLLRDLKKAE